ncbi:MULTISPECIES: HugZ family protein [unclassified Pseudomonas]|uniref:HugZ family pyridoxamine 5'-phosphate oxidase n=1 Tax=unclassified Pseudomonas TaxID=196821 RepID=UPI002B23C7E3|nr:MULTISPECIES: HugZ family protein [unclassified Pseudomonas]MEA9978904.1 HugZ family protein [Pseudomonas sp. RTS4]MEB0198742.1 HugZ family protein [Pseudomonas sp. 5S4]MEB0248004.1 HugZ family protein [Pseudomonas sp. 10S5]
MSAKAGKHARELLLKEYRGALSTHSKSMPGFPFGSVVPYCMDDQGRPLILISRIAQHTHNLQQDPKCSLLVGERGAEDVQSVGRVTVMAEAEKIKDPAAIEAAAWRYYRFFPEAQSYHIAHDFDFWVLVPVRYRFIGGFGAIHWLDDVALANPFSGAAETSMVEHMNEDHTKAIAHYVELAGLTPTPPAVMVGVDSEGMHLLIGQGIHRLTFGRPCNTPTQVREALVELAHAEKWPGDKAQQA